MDEKPNTPAGLPRLNRAAAEDAVNIIDELGGAGHIDIDAEEAELARRERERERRGMEAIEGLFSSGASRIDEADIQEALRKAGAFDGLEEDRVTAATLKVIRLARQRQN